MQTEIKDWGGTIWGSLTEIAAMFLAAIPKIIGIVVVLIIGWFIAGLIKKGIAGLLRTTKFNDLASRFSYFFGKRGVKTDTAGFIVLIIMVGVLNALGLPVVSDILRQQILWLPNFAAALMIFVIIGLSAEAFSSLVRGAASRTEFRNFDLLATITSFAIWTFAVIIAVNQMEIAITLVEMMLITTISAMVLALGITFGLGGRKNTAEIARGWYESGKQAIPNMKKAADHIFHKSFTNDTLTNKLTGGWRRHKN